MNWLQIPASRLEIIEKPLHTGDVVRLRGDGPMMTVYSDKPDALGRFTCVWHCEDGLLITGWFPPQALYRVYI